MTTNKDPVVRDITHYINRSAGQHQRRVSEGTASSRRLLDLPVYDTMTPDPYLLHRVHHVDTDDMPKGSGVSVGGLVMPEAQPVEFAGREPLTLGDYALAAFVLAVVLLVVFSAPIAHWIVRVTG
jgi:hypothetical protein